MSAAKNTARPGLEALDSLCLPSVALPPGLLLPDLRACTAAVATPDHTHVMKAGAELAARSAPVPAAQARIGPIIDTKAGAVAREAVSDQVFMKAALPTAPAPAMVLPAIPNW